MSSPEGFNVYTPSSDGTVALADSVARLSRKPVASGVSVHEKEQSICGLNVESDIILTAESYAEDKTGEDAPIEAITLDSSRWCCVFLLESIHRNDDAILPSSSEKFSDFHIDSAL